jgi:hypothetical protein
MESSSDASDRIRHALLYDPLRHEPLAAEPWSDAAAADAIARIADDAVARFDPAALWPMHPLDEPEDADPCCMLYFGAAGVIYALRRLAAMGTPFPARTFEPTLATLLERNRVRTRDADVPSLLFGDVGILLLQWQAAPSAAVADAIFGAVERNLRNPTLEQLWGSPGTLPAAIHLFERTGDRRWSDLLTRGVTILWEQMERVPEAGAWLWTQDLYGRTARYLGGGHGFAGNVFPALRGAHMLPPDLVAGYVRRTEETLRATALRDGGLANWPARMALPADGPRPPLVQDCHGAPGILCRLPNHMVPALDGLLLEAGELVWRAGPLAKGAGLCHGTAGNGYAFLKLYRRTGDGRWLERARAFAMHAIAQSDRMAARHGQRRYSLWTGDPGVALFAQSCRLADDALPTLDVF